MKQMLMKARKGATFIEYAMLAGLVAVVVAVAAMFFGEELKQLFKSTGDQTKNVRTAVDKAEITPSMDLNKGTEQ